jgi:hypothetical protein
VGSLAVYGEEEVTGSSIFFTSSTRYIFDGDDFPAVVNWGRTNRAQFNGRCIQSNVGLYTGIA